MNGRLPEGALEMKYLSRRTVLARDGCDGCPSVSRCDVAGVRVSGREEVPRAESHGVPVCAERHHHGRMDARRGGRWRDPARRSAACVPRPDALSQRHRDAERAHLRCRPRTWRRRRRPRARRRGVPDVRAPAQDLRQGHQGRHLDGPDCGAPLRRADAFRVARAGVRRGDSGRKLRQRLQLRVQQQPVVADRYHAESAGDPAARGVRADVRVGG